MRAPLQCCSGHSGCHFLWQDHRKDACVSPFDSLPACARLSLSLLLPDAEVWHPDQVSSSFVCESVAPLIDFNFNLFSLHSFSTSVSASTAFFSWSHSASNDSSWIRRNSSATSFFALHLSFALPNPATRFGCMQLRTSFVCYRSSRSVQQAPLFSVMQAGRTLSLSVELCTCSKKLFLPLILFKSLPNVLLVVIWSSFNSSSLAVPATMSSASASHCA